MKGLIVGASALLLAGCVPAARPAASSAPARPAPQSARLVTGSISGTAGYRERIALLPTAVLEVTVVGPTGERLGTTRLITDGLQVPIRFTVAYQAREGSALRLSARILDGDGRVIFATPSPEPVSASPALMLQRAS